MRPDEIITALLVPGMGRATCKKFIEQIGDVESSNSQELYSWLEYFAESNKRVKLPDQKAFADIVQKTNEIMDKCEKGDVQLLTDQSKHWPKELDKIKDPPVLLFAKGNTDALSIKNKVAIIGTREPSSHGRKVANKLGIIFADEGMCVVSGLANGCDEEGHKGALAVDGKTIAVLPSPIDNIMPESNRDLADEIVEKDGLLLTEYYPGCAVHRSNYVDRDRLQSALSKAVIVVETARKGGTMHTVRFCKEQEKILACYKHIEKYDNVVQTEGNKLLLTEYAAFPLQDTESIRQLMNKIMQFEIEKESEQQSDEGEQLKMF